MRLGARALLFSAALLGPLEAADPYLPIRQRMVREQIEARGISDPAVLRALMETPRHWFVPPAARDLAYEDHALPIGYGATISQPFVVAWMTQVLAAGSNHRVLEIGTGSGYQAAVLARLVKHVYTIEIVPDLAKSALERLRELGYENVTVREGDGYRGWPEHAPFDRIILTAAPPSIPQALIDQLVPGGRMVAPVGDSFGQELVVVEKAKDGSVRKKSIGSVMFVPMRPGRE